MFTVLLRETCVTCVFRYTRARMLTGLSPHGSGNSPAQKPPDPRRSPEQPNYEAVEAPGGPLESCSLFTESVPSPTWGPCTCLHPGPRGPSRQMASGLCLSLQLVLGPMGTCLPWLTLYSHWICQAWEMGREKPGPAPPST